MKKLEAQNIFKEFGTPIFIFDERVLKSRIDYLRKRIPEEINLCYAVKANAFLIPCLAGSVNRLEVCSPGEYDICKKYGISVNQMVISGVNKTKEYIQRIVADDLQENGSCYGTYTIESLQHGEILESISRELEMMIPVLIRLSSGNQFGIGIEEIIEIIKHRKDRYSHLFIKGIQYFSGTQRHSMKKNAREIAHACELMDQLENSFGFQCEEFEYGTGFPVCYFQGENFDEEAFLKDFSEIIQSVSSKRKVILEIGRSIAASCGSYATQVVDLKSTAGQNYAILDGGIHQLVYYGQTMAMRHPYYELYPKIDIFTQINKETKNWNLCGSLCTTNDILVKQLPVKGLREGDIFLFENTGAYSVTEGISLFLSRQLPKVVLIKENDKVILARDTIETSTLNS